MSFMDKQNGFTLIEVILTLIILSIMGTMMYSYFNSVMLNGAIPLIQIQKSLELQSAMEKITADYYDIIGNGNNLDQLKVNEDTLGTLYNDDIIREYKYGTYGIEKNIFIKFKDSSEVEISAGDPGPKNILKIIIYNELGETLTSLFTDPNNLP